MEGVSCGREKSPLIQFIEYLNRNEVAAALTLVHPDFVGEDLAMKERIEGIEALRAQIDGWGATNFSQKITHVVDAGSSIAIEGVMKGIHKDPFPIGGDVYPPTGKPLEFRFCTVATIRDGKLASETHYYDLEALRDQLRNR